MHAAGNKISREDLGSADGVVAAERASRAQHYQWVEKTTLMYSHQRYTQLYCLQYYGQSGAVLVEKKKYKKKNNKHGKK